MTMTKVHLETSSTCEDIPVVAPKIIIRKQIVNTINTPICIFTHAHTPTHAIITINCVLILIVELFQHGVLIE